MISFYLNLLTFLLRTVLYQERGLGTVETLFVGTVETVYLFNFLVS